MYKTIYNNPVERQITTYPWVYWDSAFTVDEIKTIIDYCGNLEKENATIIGTNDTKETEKFRVSEIKFVHIMYIINILFHFYYSFLKFPSFYSDGPNVWPNESISQSHSL